MSNYKVRILTDFLLVSVFFLIIFLLADFFKVFELLPRSIHQWRQCDGYSMAINYFQEGSPLLEPKVHFLGNSDGKAVGEFPILYFIDAQLWKLAGNPSIVIARLFHFSFFFLAIFLVFRGLADYLKNRFIASIGVILLMISPVILFYSNTTTPSVPAFSLVLISWYILYQYFKKKHLIWIFMAIICFSLAGLLRVSMLLGLLAFSGAWFVMWLKKENREKLIFNFKTVLFITVIPVLTSIVWVNFSKAYNLKALSGLFLTKTLPFWESENPSEVWESFLMKVFPESYSQWVLILIVIGIIIVLLSSKTLNRFLVFFLIFLTLEIAAYFSLFYANFNVHDYYIIEFFLLTPVLVALFAEWFQKRHFSKLWKTIVSIVVILVLIQGMLYSASRIRMKYNEKVFGLTKVFLTDKEIELWQWIDFIYEIEMLDFETVTPTLRKLGINRSDKFVVLSDNSPNISLSFMDQKGLTEPRDFEQNLDEKIKHWAEREMQYAIVNYSSNAVVKMVENGLLEKIKTYRHLNIYRFHFDAIRE